MEPTSDQIQHAAYERWLRRGRIHGHHDGDWYGAEKELAFLLNYQTFVEYPLVSAEPRVLDNASIRRCRFCERTDGQAAFGRAQAVVAALSEAPSLFTAELCSDCQADWRDPLDRELREFWQALRADRVGFDAQGRPTARPSFTIGAFKALIAGAILILPETDLPAVVDTMEWVSNPDHDCDDNLFAGILLPGLRRTVPRGPLRDQPGETGRGRGAAAGPARVPRSWWDRGSGPRAAEFARSGPRRSRRASASAVTHRRVRPRFPGGLSSGAAVGPIPEAPPRGAPASFDGFLRIRHARHTGPRREHRTRLTPGHAGSRARPGRSRPSRSRRSWSPRSGWASPRCDLGRRSKTQACGCSAWTGPFPPGGAIPPTPTSDRASVRNATPVSSRSTPDPDMPRPWARPTGGPCARQLDGQTVADPELAEVSWNYQYRDGQLHIRRMAQGKVEDCIAEYAFGSGHHALTFVNVIDPKIPAILEHRITYYTVQHALGLDPRPQHPTAPCPIVTPLGGVLPPATSRKCFACHTTQTSARDNQLIDEKTMIPNVSCERCHGPGRAHVEAARRGADGRSSSSRSVRAVTPPIRCWCSAGPATGIRPGLGPARSGPTTPIWPASSRSASSSRVAFARATAPLVASPAMIPTRGHRPTGRRIWWSASRATPAAAGTRRRSRPAYKAPLRIAGSPCPVAPRGDCVHCHMPRVDAGQNVLFADHWIRPRHPGNPRCRCAVPRRT